MLEKSIGFLLENANLSIKRRIKSEVLHNMTSDEAVQHAEDITPEKIVMMKIL
jgi:hypothetical protein